MRQRDTSCLPYLYAAIHRKHAGWTFRNRRPDRDCSERHPPHRSRPPPAPSPASTPTTCSRSAPVHQDSTGIGSSAASRRRRRRSSPARYWCEVRFSGADRSADQVPHRHRSHLAAPQQSRIFTQAFCFTGSCPTSASSVHFGGYELQLGPRRLPARLLLERTHRAGCVEPLRLEQHFQIHQRQSGRDLRDLRFRELARSRGGLAFQRMADELRTSSSSSGKATSMLTT